jgi:hypothetical protein
VATSPPAQSTRSMRYPATTEPMLSMPDSAA